MKITPEGLALLKRFEGFRGKAYQDSVGVWTIGYGHTSMAGPPKVTPGLTLSRTECEKILARDVALFSRGVAAKIKRPINDNQFSALTSFAYNVGLGNFAKSSVLAAVNSGHFDAVPRRLQLWVKAGGKTLPGLVKRRAAEGELFASASISSELPIEPPIRPPIEPPVRPPVKPPAPTGETGVAAGAGLAALLAWLHDNWWILGAVLAAAVVIGIIIYKIRRRNTP
jgi:lysozyme